MSQQIPRKDLAAHSIHQEQKPSFSSHAYDAKSRATHCSTHTGISTLSPLTNAPNLNDFEDFLDNSDDNLSQGSDTDVMFYPKENATPMKSPQPNVRQVDARQNKFATGAENSPVSPL